MSCVLGLVERAVVETCPYCRRPVVVVEVKGRKGAGWSQTESHACVRTALSDLVDAEIFGDGGVS